MYTNTLSVLFLIERNKINKQGKCPIKCRLTFLTKRKRFSTGLFIEPENWNNKEQFILSECSNHEFMNSELSLIKHKLEEAFLFLQVNSNAFDVEDILLQYRGESTKSQKTILEVFEIHNKKVEALIGKEYAKSTYSKFLEAKKHVQNFIRFTYKKNDMLLEAIKLTFLDDLDFYLKSQLNHKQITINKTIQRLRKIIKLAVAEGFLDRDPFMLYTPKRFEKKVIYLSAEELSKLENHVFSQPRLNKVKDLFIFCCYTGLAYAEMDALSQKHLVKKFDGNIWIEMYRQKTKSQVSIPLLPKANYILDKYKSLSATSDKLLPTLSNQKINSYLKEIADILGIEKRLTHHIARKTFATTILLYNDVPMEIVSELLGHSKITITQAHYAKVIQKKLSEEISCLGAKLKE